MVSTGLLVSPTSIVLGQGGIGAAVLECSTAPQEPSFKRLGPDATLSEDRAGPRPADDMMALGPQHSF
jgi:hypothetical protein